MVNYERAGVNSNPYSGEYSLARKIACLQASNPIDAGTLYIAYQRRIDYLKSLNFGQPSSFGTETLKSEPKRAKKSTVNAALRSLLIAGAIAFPSAPIFEQISRHFINTGPILAVEAAQWADILGEDEIQRINQSRSQSPEFSVLSNQNESTLSDNSPDVRREVRWIQTSNRDTYLWGKDEFGNHEQAPVNCQDYSERFIKQKPEIQKQIQSSLRIDTNKFNVENVTCKEAESWRNLKKTYAFLPNEIISDARDAQTGQPFNFKATFREGPAGGRFYSFDDEFFTVSYKDNSTIMFVRKECGNKAVFMPSEVSKPTPESVTPSPRPSVTPRPTEVPPTATTIPPTEVPPTETVPPTATSTKEAPRQIVVCIVENNQFRNVTMNLSEALQRIARAGYDNFALINKNPQQFSQEDIGEIQRAFQDACKIPATPTNTPTPTATATVTPTPGKPVHDAPGQPEQPGQPAPSATPTPTPTATLIASQTPVATLTPAEQTATPRVEPSPTGIATFATETPKAVTSTPTPTATLIATQTPVATLTPAAATATPRVESSPTAMATVATATPESTEIPPTATATLIATQTAVATLTRAPATATARIESSPTSTAPYATPTPKVGSSTTSTVIQANATATLIR